MAETIKLPALPGADPPDPTSDNDPVELLRSELASLKSAFEEFTSLEKPELERLQSELQSATAQRDQNADELQQLKRRQSVAEISAEYGFGDAEYLDFVLRKHQIDPADTQTTAEFMQRFRNTHPNNFNLPVKPGSGSRPEASFHTMHNSNLSRMDALENMLSGAPEIY